MVSSLPISASEARLDGQLDGERFEFRADANQLADFGARERSDHAALIGLADDEPLVFERHQRLANRGLADADIARDARFHDAVAGFEVARHDHVADGFGDLIGQGRTTAQLL